jgi:hypothetical protein
MVDDDSDDQPFYAPNHKPQARQPRTPGFKQWELRHGNRVLVCEFHDNERVGAGVDVQLLEGGEILVSTACIMADAARYVAERFKRDHPHTGWVEIS